MSKDDFLKYQTFIPIPKIFHSDLTESPMSNCTMCDCDLLHTEIDYLIEKAFKRNKEYGTSETIFEVAICFKCVTQFRSELSKESLQAIDQYYTSHVDWNQRHNQLIESSPDDIEPWLKECVISNKDIHKIDEYQIYGQCYGNELFLTNLPYMVSGKSIDQIVHLLSPKTKDEIKGFMDDNLGFPPEWKELIDDGKVLLV